MHLVIKARQGYWVLYVPLRTCVRLKPHSELSALGLRRWHLECSLLNFSILRVTKSIYFSSFFIFIIITVIFIIFIYFLFINFSFSFFLFLVFFFLSFFCLFFFSYFILFYLLFSSSLSFNSFFSFFVWVESGIIYNSDCKIFRSWSDAFTKEDESCLNLYKLQISMSWECKYECMKKFKLYTWSGLRKRKRKYHLPFRNLSDF